MEECMQFIDDSSNT